MRSLKLTALAIALLSSAAVRAEDATETPHPPAQSWTFAGLFGHYDRAQLQRGYQIYKQVCSSCHGIELVSFRNLSQKGGPEFSEAEVKALAADTTINALDDEGQPVEKPAKPSDRLKSPYANPVIAAASNGGKAPPDLSVMAKARGYERGFPLFLADVITGANTTIGPDYIYALLNGFEPKPADVEGPENANYNKYYPGHFIAMAKPLTDGQVTYQDGSPQTVDQYARDVTSFLMWAAEPKLEERKRIGFEVMVFLVLFCGLLYFTKKKVWDGMSDKPQA